jgi:thiol-disulfide isomerase/thioredoxin
MKTLLFYTKLGCSDCEAAHRLLMELAFDLPLEIDMIDVTHAHNQNIRDTYSNRIPVIVNPKADTELDWPFTTEQVKAYLVSNEK